MRHQLKSKTPSAAARLRYITRHGRYATGLDGPRDDLRVTGNANLPAWSDGVAAVFWSATDGFERANARRCLELELNLPRELTLEQQIAVVHDYIMRLSVVAGPMPITWAIHDAGDGNPHVHLMIQERPLDGHERTAEQHFKRANRQKPEKGGAIKSTWWHDPQHVFWSRALWADACNVALVNGGHEARFDARSKAVRLDEALRAGDLRGAALLTTVTERHEGHAVAGMRRRVDRGEVDLDELPDYAQQLIAHNDRARTYNCWLRDWSRTASDAELRTQLAGPLAELRERLEAESPSAHIAAWEAAQHAQALGENRERDAAAARAAGELELLTDAQSEAAERAELAALVELEQGDHLDDLLGIERAQAHAAALIENREWEVVRAAELVGFVEQEQTSHLAALLAHERDQAHAAALVEDTDRDHAVALIEDMAWEAGRTAEIEAAYESALAEDAQRTRLVAAAAARQSVEAVEARITTLQPDAVEPPEVAAVTDLTKAVIDAQKAAHRAANVATKVAQEARYWREQHPVKARAADALGVPLKTDIAAHEAKLAADAAERVQQQAVAAYNDSPAHRVVIAWRQAVRELEQLQGKLPALKRIAHDAQMACVPRERMLAGIEQQLDRLERLEAYMQSGEAHNYALLREELAGRAADAGTPEALVTIYRDAQRLADGPARDAAELGTQVRSTELVHGIHEALKAARQVIKRSGRADRPETRELLDKLEQRRQLVLHWMIDPAVRPALEQLEREIEGANQAAQEAAHLLADIARTDAVAAGEAAEQLEWIEFERDGELFGFYAERPDEIYWHHLGNWHLQEPEPPGAESRPRSPQQG
ncbi:MobA/MobL family protein [Geopseudomonas aromaticivorans]